MHIRAERQYSCSPLFLAHGLGSENNWFFLSFWFHSKSSIDAIMTVHEHIIQVLKAQKSHEVSLSLPSSDRQLTSHWNLTQMIQNDLKNIQKRRTTKEGSPSWVESGSHEYSDIALNESRAANSNMTAQRQEGISQKIQLLILATQRANYSTNDQRPGVLWMGSDFHLSFTYKTVDSCSAETLKSWGNLTMIFKANKKYPNCKMMDQKMVFLCAITQFWEVKVHLLICAFHCVAGCCWLVPNF